MLSFTPLTNHVRCPRYSRPKLSLNLRRPIGSPPPEWWTAKGLLQYRNRLPSMIHTMFHILYVLSCFITTLSLPCLSSASLLDYFRWFLEQPALCLATWCRRDSSWRPINIWLSSDWYIFLQQLIMEFGLSRLQCDVVGRDLPFLLPRKLHRCISSVHLSRFSPRWQPKWVPLLPLTLHRPMWRWCSLARYRVQYLCLRSGARVWAHEPHVL